MKPGLHWIQVLMASVCLFAALAYAAPMQEAQTAPTEEPVQAQPATPQNAGERKTEEQKTEEAKPSAENTMKKKPAAPKKPQKATSGSKSSKSKAKQRHKTSTKKPDTTDHPEKTVVKHGGTIDPALRITPVESPEQKEQKRQNIHGLLAATEENLKKVSGKELSTQQKDALEQIRNYMAQAHAADTSGDLQGAENLASKAKQLSDDIVKH